MEVARGEVWQVDFSPTRGTEQAGMRPALILQTDRANLTSPHTIVAPFTSRIRRSILPSHVRVPVGEGGLTQDSVLMCEQIRVIDQQRLIRKLGVLQVDRMNEVAEALRNVLEL